MFIEIVEQVLMKFLFSLIYDKYMALKEEIDYETYIVKHEAADCMI